MAEQLTQDIWELILVHVPPADRLGRCALVSQKLHKAAAAATDALKLAFAPGQEQRAEAFCGYLQQHGMHLTSLQLEHRLQQPLAQLPCSRLLDLELRASRVQLGPHNGLPGVLASCTALTRLGLSDCRVPAGLFGLSGLVSLRDLHLVDLHLVDLLLSREQWVPPTLSGSVFTSMQHLTRLQLSYVDVEDVHHVSCLSSLAVLNIYRPGAVRLAPDIAPGFVLPASLHDLSLTGIGVQLGPAVLSAVAQLTRLELRWLTVVGEADMSSGAALLAAVSGLHKLDTLQLSELLELDGGALAWPEPSAAYQALTASSRLRSLRVLNCQLPAGGWVHVFSPPAVCGELQSLDTFDDMSVEAVSALAQCCPRLQHLLLHVGSSPAVAALKPLTCLTCLDLTVHVGGEADAAQSVRGVAALTSLHDLRLYLECEGDGTNISRAALLPLTALTQLTRCDTHPCELANQAGPGQPPDVWQQLQQYCLGDDTDSTYEAGDTDSTDDTDDTDDTDGTDGSDG